MGSREIKLVAISIVQDPDEDSLKSGMAAEIEESTVPDGLNVGVIRRNHKSLPGF